MIYQRDPENPLNIVNETMVIKGSWKLSVEEQLEEFIYKKINKPIQEDLLTELFCEDPNQKISSANTSIRAPNEQL